MCEQTEIAYLPNEIVWVKLGPVWWPGEVQEYDSLPEEITGDLRKQPIAVVKFFQEDSYEYIKNLNHIYRYNCLKKTEFIKKGLDLCRSTNSRNVPSNMKMFPADIVTAEKRTGGDPDILKSELFLPEQKKSYTELFGTPKKVSAKEGSGSGRRGRPPASESKSKVSTPISSSTPSHRSITHPRFVGESRSNTPDYESRVRQQPPPDGDVSPTNLYRCHVCDFSTKRLNVIVMHNKSHTGTNVDFSTKDSDITIKKHTPRIKSLSTPKIKQTGEAPKRKLVTESSSAPKKANTSPAVPKKEKPPVKSVVDQEPKPAAKKRGPKPTKAEKQTKVLKVNEAIRENLLKDWDDEDESAEEEEKSKQCDEKSISESLSCNDGNESMEGEKELKDEGPANGEADEKLKEKSCFDFDDSEDSPPKNPIPFSRKTSAAISDGLCIPETDIKADKEVEEFQKKIDDLLDETVVPKFPTDFKVLATRSENSTNEPAKLTIADPEPLSNQSECISSDLLVDETSAPLVSNFKCNDAIGSIKEEYLNEAKNEPIIKTEADASASDNDEGAAKSTEKTFKSSYPSNSKSLTFDYNPEPPKKRRQSSCTNSNLTSLAATADSYSALSSSAVSADAAFENASTSSVPDTSNETHVDPVTETVETTESVYVELKPITGDVREETEKNFKEIAPESSVITTQVVSSSTKSESIVVGLTSSSSEVVSGNSLASLSHESSLSHTGETQSLPKPVGSSGRRGRPPGPRMVVAKPALSCPSILSGRRRSNSKKFDDTTSNIQVSQRIERGSRFAPKAQKVTVIESGVTNPNPKPSSTAEAQLTSAEVVEPAESSELVESVTVVPEPVLEETFVIGGEQTISADETTKGGMDVVSTSTNDDLNFDINSLPIIIDNSEYTPCSEYEKIETAPAIPDSLPVEAPQSVAPVKVEQRKAIKLKNPTSFLEKALINCDGTSSTSNVVKSTKKIPIAAKTERGATSTVLVPGQASGTTTKVRTLKIPGTAKFFSPNAKSQNSFLLLKTPTGQQFLKSSQLIHQPGGKMLIVTANQSPLNNRSSLIVKGFSKGEPISSSKISTSRLITSKGIVSSSINDTECASGSKSAANLLPKVSGDNSSKNKAGPSQIGAKPKILGKVSNSSGVVFSTEGNISTKNVVLSGKQAGMSKVIITSKPGSTPGTKLIMHSSPTKVVLPASMRQKLIGSSSSSPNIIVQSSRSGTPSTVAVQVSSTNKLLVSQASSSTPTATVQKIVRVQKQGPNILQKQQRKTATKTISAVTSSKVVPATVSSVASNSLSVTPADSVILPSSTSVSVIPNSPSAVTQPVMYVAVDNNTYQPVDSSMLAFDASQQPGQTYFINPGSANLENIFLTLDEKGNYNLAQPSSQLFTSDVAAPSQDILAKALADTQVLQTEASIADATGRVAYIESLPYPAPSLTSNVLETSLTLNQPIMTPLEVPSSATPVSSNFNLLGSNQSADTAKSTQETFITQIPGVSSNVSFQIVDQQLVAAPSVELHPAVSSASVDTNIDEDLIKINKPTKPSKNNLIQNEDMSCDQQNSFLVETQPGNEVQIESSYIISESDTSVPSVFVDSSGTLGQALPPPPSDNGDPNSMVLVSVPIDAVSDKSSSLKDVVVSENDLILEPEVVNGVGTNCQDIVSPSKVTKDLGVSCQEPEGNSNRLPSAPSDQPVCEG